MRSAEFFVKCLENEGVHYIFGVPGEENIDVMDALLDSNIEFITTRHETGAAFMASAMGRLTGQPGVCLSTLGPGATNMVTGVATGNMDQTPMVAIVGQADMNRLHKESHQAYDLVSMYNPVTKWGARIPTPETISEIVRKAFKVAKDEKPGATLIEFPEDVAKAESEATSAALAIADNDEPMGTHESIQGAAELIKTAEFPVILVGNGVTRLHASEELVRFAEKIQAPVAETFMGKGAISWEHSLSLMTVGLSDKDYVSCVLDQADLILSIGYDMAEMPPTRWDPSGKIPVLHIDTKNAEVDASYRVVETLCGDIKKNLAALTEVVPKRDQAPEIIKKVRDRILEEFHSFAEDTHFPVKPQKIIHDLRTVMNPEDIALSDVGAHKMWMARMFHCYQPNTCLISNGLASMGVAVPGAIGAKLTHPDKKVVAVCGDGGFLMTGMELETAVRLNLSIVILIWRDNGYGLIEWKQRKAFQRTSHIEFGDPDFVKLAESFGAKGLRVERTEELQSILREALEHDGPVVVECPVDYSENMKLTKRLAQLDCDF
ncbi:acetolactate synthase-1/2/3 large subunit [Pullulanibacillus pueri]|uniref:Acetolactate synthase n=1 Tax=Pullulanibacillus pueri TaxID=1437324 RepID=A0A8J3ELE1_9BACL|nr:acetolactate synthase large subunit [Pullulanibacillus pueri]MBM7680737.1 acetolactate synthase-1/2/3 large subunit [Pullulanibacillus pueri]GGH78142.1 acetolactate synthase [Pullulanibacillus pueri]